MGLGGSTEAAGSMWLNGWSAVSSSAPPRSCSAGLQPLGHEGLQDCSTVITVVASRHPHPQMCQDAWISSGGAGSHVEGCCALSFSQARTCFLSSLVSPASCLTCSRFTRGTSHLPAAYASPTCATAAALDMNRLCVHCWPLFTQHAHADAALASLIG